MLQKFIYLFYSFYLKKLLFFFNINIKNYNYNYLEDNELYIYDKFFLMKYYFNN